MKRILVLSLIAALSIIMIGISFSLGTKPKHESAKELDLNIALKSGLPVVLKLGADYCPPCKKMKPIIAGLSEEYKGKIIFLDYDIYKHDDLTKKFKVVLIPTIVFFNKHGVVKGKVEGFLNKEEIMAAVRELKLDK